MDILLKMKQARIIKLWKNCIHFRFDPKIGDVISVSNHGERYLLAHRGIGIPKDCVKIIN